MVEEVRLFDEGSVQRYAKSLNVDGPLVRIGLSGGCMRCHILLEYSDPYHGQSAQPLWWGEVMVQVNDWGTVSRGEWHLSFNHCKVDDFESLEDWLRLMRDGYVSGGECNLLMVDLGERVVATVVSHTDEGGGAVISHTGRNNWHVSCQMVALAEQLVMHAQATENIHDLLMARQAAESLYRYLGLSNQVVL